MKESLYFLSCKLRGKVQRKGMIKKKQAFSDEGIRLQLLF